ncbi:MAG TPA: MBL fold metallo-hydrolase [Draconibacterium sp.]|nr:MBL fold metallo-hydrolase [Draconibacterium sp.]
MKINILTDNVAGSRYKAEHGLSYLLEIDGEKILFDTGHSNLFLENAAQMGINIQDEVLTVVLSHGHWDHGNGLKYLKNKTLIAHPGIFSKRYRKKDHSYLGLNLEQNEAEKTFNLQLSSSPVRVTSHLWFLGEIPRINDFEAKSTTFVLENGEEDFVSDDSALVAIKNNELIIISGCAHSGICNICEYAKELTGISKIKAVIGGFHLKDQGEQTIKTIEYFKQNQIELPLPSHCTELLAKVLFQQQFNFPEVKTGLSFSF